MSGVPVAFQREVQSLAALKEAAYRLIGEASCQIESTADTYLCRLIPAKGNAKSEEELRCRFLDLVTDENLREKLASETSRTRDLILALAFGAMAEKAGRSEPA